MKDSLKIYCDGGARGNPGPAAAAFVVEKNGKAIFKGHKFLGQSTNNVAEYSAVSLASRWLVKNIGEAIDEVYFVLDSELVAKQLAGVFKIKNENLKSLYFTIKELEERIPAKVFYTVVPRTKNRLADFLVNKVLDENS